MAAAHEFGIASAPETIHPQAMNRIVQTLIALALLAVPASAGGRKPPSDDLPGVDRSAGTSAVGAPRPEPADGLPAGSRPGSFRVGDWDITISGSISYEIGTGRPRDGR